MVCCCVQYFTSKWFFLNFRSAHEAPTYQTFSPFQFASNANDHRIADTEFFGNFLCSCKRIRFDNAPNWLLSTSTGQPQHSSSSRLSFLQNFLNHPYTACSLAVAGPNALLMLQVVFATLQPILNLNNKVAQICFLSSIISIV